MENRVTNALNYRKNKRMVCICNKLVSGKRSTECIPALSNLLSSSQVAESQCTWLSDTTGRKCHFESSNNSNRPRHKRVSTVSFVHTIERKLSLLTLNLNTACIFSHFTLLTCYSRLVKEKNRHSSIYDKLHRQKWQTFIINTDCHFQLQMQNKAKCPQHISPKPMLITTHLSSLTIELCH